MFRIKASISTMVFIEILDYLLDLACPKDGKKFTLKLLQFQTLVHAFRCLLTYIHSDKCQMSTGAKFNRAAQFFKC